MSWPVVQFFISTYALAKGTESIANGLKEGDMGKAIMGGISAYAGFSGLSGLANLGTEAATAAAEGAATETAASGTAAEASAAAPVTDTVAETTGGLASSPEATQVSGLGTNASDSSMLGDVGNWFEKNPKLGYGLLQLGGGMLQGNAQERMMKEQQDREERLARESRERRGYSAPSGLLNYRYNPMTGKMENANGAA